MHHRMKAHRRKIVRRKVKDHGRDPRCEGDHNNGNEGVHQTLHPKTQIELGHIDKAGDKRKAWDDKEGGADIAGLVIAGNLKGPF